MSGEWISIQERCPGTSHRVLGWNGVLRAVVYRCESGLWYNDDGHDEYPRITHWMPLPDPPPRESSFERWWQSCGMVGGQEYCRYIGYREKAPLISPTMQSTAKVIWDAAVAAYQKGDYVP